MDKELLQRILGYLEPSNFTTLEYVPSSLGLRRAADMLDQKERDIRTIKEFINNLENN